MGQTIAQGPQLEGVELSHPPETYHQSEAYTGATVWTGAGDQADYSAEGAQGSYSYDGVPAPEGSQVGPSHEGAPVVESGSSANPGGEDKKKKKKEKVSIFSLMLSMLGKKSEDILKYFFLIFCRKYT